MRAGAKDRHEAAAIVETFLTIISDSLLSGEDVLISGFGKFAVRERMSRKGRNIKAGLEVLIPARKKVIFRPSPNLAGALNAGEAPQQNLVAVKSGAA